MYLKGLWVAKSRFFTLPVCVRLLS